MNPTDKLGELLSKHGAEEGEKTYALKQEIKQLFLDIVGEDNTTQGLLDSTRTEHRNQLRAELREKISKL